MSTHMQLARLTKYDIDVESRSITYKAMLYQSEPRSQMVAKVPDKWQNNGAQNG